MNCGASLLGTTRRPRFDRFRRHAGRGLAPVEFRPRWRVQYPFAITRLLDGDPIVASDSDFALERRQCRNYVFGAAGRRPAAENNLVV